MEERNKKKKQDTKQQQQTVHNNGFNGRDKTRLTRHNRKKHTKHPCKANTP